MANGFRNTLEYIRSVAETEARRGHLFERLMKAFFELDPLYRDRFAKVQLWSEWAAARQGFDRSDIGIDLVAEERAGGVCAIQCKCHAANTRISKAGLDSFIAASAREPFTARIVVDTGEEWGPNASKTITGLKPACSVLRFGDLANRPLDWPDLIRQQPEDLSLLGEPFLLREHQQRAVDDVLSAFKKHDRGKLVMACGTGKTFTALRIAEAVAGMGGRVLYLVPSISLFQQSMREWAEQRETTHRYIGICSDVRAGRSDEDASFLELEIPVTTEPSRIRGTLQQTSSSSMTVVFCTYHSLGLVEQAQERGAPSFDLVLCDEAHRTTGIERPGEDTSPFVLVHDANRIRAAKRLYMTATPRLYTRSAKSKAANHDVDVFSMDDDAVFGPEFHRLPFSRAVEEDLLSDYKVVVLALSERRVDRVLQSHLATSGGTIKLSDAARIVGCWQALHNPENRKPAGVPLEPLRRAIAFTDRINSSKLLEKHWSNLVEKAVEQLPEARQNNALQCEVKHVDGQHHALDRKARIEWLKGAAEGTCRILSNARCLAEGIDVPALDAVIFMNERRSVVDIVQAVGRTMRKAEGKTYGYIILPIAVPAGRDPAMVLDSGREFDVVWSVLQALRSHDDRFDVEVNQLDLNAQPADRIIFSGGDSDDKALPMAPMLAFPPLDLPPGAFYAKIVEKCGDRKYWESWAKDVAEIFGRLVMRIGRLLSDPDNSTLSEWFEAFHDELKVSINDSITAEGAIDMMAQHILTRPVFDALFEGYDFVDKNPVAHALDELRLDFGEFGLENETRDLASFYESVRLRARGLDNPAARQHVLMELYEKFFSTAMKKDADRLGIVYTPLEIVDFILASADHVVQSEFGRGLTDEDIHVLDPFTGTGIFLVRLLQSNLILDQDLKRKYREELHANELVLLAYYIAAIHIEEAYHGRAGGKAGYEPFGGIVLTDTFNLHTGRAGFPKDWLPENSKRAERQQGLPIHVIVGNPPWSAGQRSAADDNPNIAYPEIEARIAETYASRSKATLKSSLYDTYKMAIRWASDRIGDRGVVAYVTNASWIDGIVDAGVRACLAEEFSSIHVLNLRGNRRTQGERSRREGGEVFGQGSRAPVAITILARNPDAQHEGCRIRYRDIGDCLSREDKLKQLSEWQSTAEVKDWVEVAPDRHYDWIRQRDDAFQSLYPLGTRESKSGKSSNAVFKLYSNGYKSGRDFYVYNFDSNACAANARRMVGDYNGALRELRSKERDKPNINDVVKRHSSHLRWDREQRRRLRKRVETKFSAGHLRRVAYRPFVKQWLYSDYTFSQAPGQTKRMFPTDGILNRAICVSGVGSTKPFSAIMVDTMPDLALISCGQMFPRYRFAQRGEAPLLSGKGAIPEVFDNIADAALTAFRDYYGNKAIDKDAIFNYVYGIVHAPEYRKRFENDLAKELPRVPLAGKFYAFADAGRRLGDLHLGYETCSEFALDTKFRLSNDPNPEHYKIGQRPMRFMDDAKTVLAINDNLQLTGIPPEAHEYLVDGRTPLEWFLDRYRITQDKQSGIINDPNDWFEDPRDLVVAIRRIVHVSVETVAIVKDLPCPFAGRE